MKQAPLPPLLAPQVSINIPLLCTPQAEAEPAGHTDRLRACRFERTGVPGPAANSALVWDADVRLDPVRVGDMIELAIAEIGSSTEAPAVTDASVGDAATPIDADAQSERSTHE